MNVDQREYQWLDVMPNDVGAKALTTRGLQGWRVIHAHADPDGKVQVLLERTPGNTAAQTTAPSS